MGAIDDIVAQLTARDAAPAAAGPGIGDLVATDMARAQSPDQMQTNWGRGLSRYWYGDQPKAVPGQLPEADMFQDPVSRAAKGAVELIKTPGAVMVQNPYPDGTEEHAWFENNRAETIARKAPEMAMATMGAGMPFAEAGAVGAAGGRLTAVRNPINGKLQVAPRQVLTDAFVAGGPPVEAAAPYVPLRANGRFANQRDAARAEVLTPDKVTAPAELVQPNAMYDLNNPPPIVASRLETPQMNGSELDVNHWRRQMPMGDLVAMPREVVPVVQQAAAPRSVMPNAFESEAAPAMSSEQATMRAMDRIREALGVR